MATSIRGVTQFEDDGHTHAVTSVTASPLAREVILSGNVESATRRSLAISRRIAVEAADAMMAIGSAVKLMSDEALQTTEAAIINDQIRVAPFRCRATNAWVVGLWLCRRWLEDEDIPPIVTLPMSMVSDVVAILRKAGRVLAGEDEVKRLAVSKGHGLAFDYTLFLSIYVHTNGDRFLRLQQVFGQSNEKSAVIYIPETAVGTLPDIMRDVANSGVAEDFRGLVITVMRGQVVLAARTPAYFATFPDYEPKSKVRVPTAVFPEFKLALVEMIGG